MLNAIVEFFLAKPQRLVALGAALFQSGATLILLGLIGDVAKVGASAFAATRAAPPSLSDIYPGLPLGFVPESVVGFASALLLAGAGLAAVGFGKHLRQWIEG